MKKLTKLQLVLIPILLTISPIVILVIIGILYIGVMMMIGNSLTAGYESFLNLIDIVKPYFGYLTAIPVAALVIVSTIKIKLNKKYKSKE